MKKTTMLLRALAASLALAPAIALSYETTVFATGLTGPVKIDLTRQGNLLVTEQGTANNDGELSRIDRDGSVQTILSGLPSGIETTGSRSGPQSPVVDGCCVVHLTIGEGDMLRFDPAGPPGRQVPNLTGSVSPIFSSVLRLVFNRPLDQLSAGFVLTREHHDALADGRTVRLDNAAGDRVWIRMVVDFKDARPDALTNVRGSNPFHMILSQHEDGLLVVDSGQNALLEVGGGWPRVVVRFPRVAQAAGVVPPFSDAVPTAVRHLRENKYLVSTLTGVPFTPGVASIQLVNASSGASTTFIAGLTSVTDLLVAKGDFFVLEISANRGAGAPGRLLRFANRHSAPVEVSTGLIGGSGLAYVPKRNAIFIAELFTGRILRVDL
jgi:hypothetical protein